MLQNTITINGSNYDLVSQMPYRSMRSNAARPVSEPKTFTVAHETTKSGLRNSVIVVEDVAMLNTGTSTIKDSIKGQIKISYKPYSGRADIEAAITSIISDLTAFISVSENLDKIMNQES